MRAFLIAVLALALTGAWEVRAERSSSHHSTAPQTNVNLSGSGREETSGIYGGMDIRPSWASGDGKVFGEEYVEAGYKFSKYSRLGYRQEMLSNIYHSDNAGASPTFYDGFLRGNFEKLWESSVYRVSFNYEPRLYFPTDAVKRNAGLIVMARNYFKLKSELSSTFWFETMEVPIAHVYSTAGTGTTANPAFENRVYFGPEILMFNKKVDLYFPLILTTTRYSEYAPDTVNGGELTEKLWIYPELTYKFRPNLAAGVAYYSENLIAPDVSGLDVGNGFQKGVTQLIFQLGL